jgi:hypothetical protein
MAARSTTEVQESIATAIQTVDPSANTRRGPLKRAWIDPIATEVQKNEADADHLAQLVSLNASEATTDDELDSRANAFGLERGDGKASVGFATFFTSIRPGSTQTLTVPLGTLVGTDLGGLVYQTTTEVNLIGASADIYFNDAERRFEITAPIEALAVGADHDVPSTRINRILSALDDFQGVVNTADVEGGTSRQTNAELDETTRTRLLGIDRGVNGGLISEVLLFDPTTVTAAVPVYSTDIALFRRRTTRPAIDLYVLGSYNRIVSDSFVTGGGETSFGLSSPPVLSITDVLVNGLSVTFTVVKDTTRETGGSTLANDRIALSAPAGIGDLVQVDYVANGLLLDLQATYDAEGPDSRFGTQIVLRTAPKVPIKVAISATVLGSFEVLTVTEEIQAVVLDYVARDTFVATLTPEELDRQIRTEVAGLSRLQITVFARVDGGASFGIIDLEKNEIPSTDSSLIALSVRR